MPNLLSFQTHHWSCFDSHVDQNRFNAIQSSATSDEAKATRTLFEKITDWLSITHLDKAFDALHTLTQESDIPLNHKQFTDKVSAFFTLHQSLKSEYQPNLTLNNIDFHGELKLQVTLTNKAETPLLSRAFTLSHSLEDIHVIKTRPLTDGAGFLNTDLKKQHANDLNTAISTLRYELTATEHMTEPKPLTSLNLSNFHVVGVDSQNQRRLDLKFFGSEPEILLKISQSPKLIQEWVSDQMKIFDHIADFNQTLNNIYLSIPNPTDETDLWSIKLNLICNQYAATLSQCFADEMRSKLMLLEKHDPLI